MLILLYVESYCCVKIDRELRDIIDLLNPTNCNDISLAYMDGRRCKCSIFYSTVSTNMGQIACIQNKNIDASKYT